MVCCARFGSSEAYIVRRDAVVLEHHVTAAHEVVCESRTRIKIWQAHVVCCACFGSSDAHTVMGNAMSC